MSGPRRSPLGPRHAAARSRTDAAGHDRASIVGHPLVPQDRDTPILLCCQRAGLELEDG